MITNFNQKTKHSVYYSPSKKYLHIKIYGLMMLEDFMELIERFETSHIISQSKIYVLFDVRESVTGINNSELVKLVEPFSELIKKCESMRFAELIQCPIKTAHGMIFRNHISHLSNLKFEIFCT